MKLDLSYVRRAFYALNNQPTSALAFFENAGGAYVPDQVNDRLQRFMQSTKVQPYAAYAASEAGTTQIELGTKLMAEFINAETSEIVLGHSTTMNFYMLSRALENSFSRGDEIVLTEQDHESNVSPWMRLVRDKGLVIKTWRLDPVSGLLDPDDLENLLGEKTRLVCMPHSSNIVGAVNDVKAIAQRVHAGGALLLVDGVSYAPHHAVDVKALDVDIYAVSLYKVFGPHLGLLYVRETLHEKLENQSLEFLPALYAGYEDREGAPNYLRIALNPGLVNHEAAAACVGIADYFDDCYRHHGGAEPASFHDKAQFNYQLMSEHEATLSQRWLDYLAEKSSIELIGPVTADPARRSPNWSLKTKSKAPKVLAQALAKKNIAVQSGSFYAWRCLRALNIDPDIGVLRISFAHFNNTDELDRLCLALDELL